MRMDREKEEIWPVGSNGEFRLRHGYDVIFEREGNGPISASSQGSLVYQLSRDFSPERTNIAPNPVAACQVKGFS